MDITPIVKLILIVLACVYSYILLPWLKDLAYWSKLKRYINMGVEAAEMLYKEHGMGEQKNKYVKEFLEAHGYSVDEDEIDNAIESSVLQLKNSLK